MSWQDHEYVMLRPLKSAAAGGGDEGGDAPVTWSKTYIASGMKLNEPKAGATEAAAAADGADGAAKAPGEKDASAANGGGAEAPAPAPARRENGEPAAPAKPAEGEAEDARTIVTSWKGYRMARASHGISAQNNERGAYAAGGNEGETKKTKTKTNAWYCELNIVHLGRTGHCRVGFSTAAAELGAPVGYDKHSYGYR